MAEAKTRPVQADAGAFLEAVEPPVRRADGLAMRTLMERVSGAPAEMWGGAIVGFGRYRSPTGEWPRIAFSPRKAELVLYVLHGEDWQPELRARLGPHRTGKSCLYIKSLAKIDVAVLEELVRASWITMAERHTD